MLRECIRRSRFAAVTSTDVPPYPRLYLDLDASGELQGNGTLAIPRRPAEDREIKASKRRPCAHSGRNNHATSLPHPTHSFLPRSVVRVDSQVKHALPTASCSSMSKSHKVRREVHDSSCIDTQRPHQALGLLFSSSFFSS